jgi:DNA-binding Lrp family transcriptional regulator
MTSVILVISSGTSSRRRKPVAESKVKDDNFFLVSGWMLNRLNLKGVSLQVFSIIYGFSQDGESYFTGSLQYLSDFTNASKPTIIKALKELVERGYITKDETAMNGVKFNKYKANLLVVKNLYQGSQETLPGDSKETLLGGSKETLPNNKDSYNKSLIDKKKVKEVLDLYHSICVSFPSVRKLTPGRSKEIVNRLATYTMDDFKAVFENAENSSFLKGDNNRKWSANFDWLIAERNIVKVLEGNYADKGHKEKVPGWMGFGMGEAELEAIRNMFKDEPKADDPETQREREQLEKELQAFRKGAS